MPDIVITSFKDPKIPLVTLDSLTEQGKMALSAAHGSHCRSLTIAKRRLPLAKKFLTERGCSVVVLNEKNAVLID